MNIQVYFHNVDLLQMQLVCGVISQPEHDAQKKALLVQYNEAHGYIGEDAHLVEEPQRPRHPHLIDFPQKSYRKATESAAYGTAEPTVCKDVIPWYLQWPVVF